jgi:hypothetical protein
VLEGVAQGENVASRFADGLPLDAYPDMPTPAETAPKSERSVTAEGVMDVLDLLLDVVSSWDD